MTTVTHNGIFERFSSYRAAEAGFFHLRVDLIANVTKDQGLHRACELY